MNHEEGQQIWIAGYKRKTANNFLKLIELRNLVKRQMQQLQKQIIIVLSTHKEFLCFLVIVLSLLSMNKPQCRWGLWTKIYLTSSSIHFWILEHWEEDLLKLLILKSLESGQPSWSSSFSSDYFPLLVDWLPCGYFPWLS